jgi:hypothetical protein
VAPSATAAVAYCEAAATSVAEATAAVAYCEAAATSVAEATTAVAKAAPATAMTKAAPATAVADQRYHTGSGLAFQDRHRGCLCRPPYKTCGEHAASNGSRHG